MQQKDIGEIKQAKKALIIKGPGIGDSVTTVPLARNLKKFIGCAVHVLEEHPPEKQGMEILQKCPYIDKIVRLDYSVWYLRPNRSFFREIFTLRFVPDIFRFAHDIMRLRAQKYDIVIEGFPGTKNTLILTRLIAPRHKICCSSHPAKIFYDINLEIRGKNTVQLENSLFGILGQEMTEEDFRFELFHDKDAAEKQAEEILKAHGISKKDKLVGITTGQGYKKWQNAKWTELIGSTRGAKVVLVGDKGQAEDAEEIKKMCKNKVVDLTGSLSLLETIVVMERMRLFVCTNGGLMWIAAALGLPTVVVSGPTPYWWDPRTANCKVVRKAGKGFYEQPRYSWLQHARTEDVTVGDVIAAIRELGEPIGKNKS